MFCCEAETSAGFARVEVATVVDRCNNILHKIHRDRSKMRREYIEQTLAKKIWWWKRLWGWFFFRKPTRRDAIYDYYHSDTPFPASFSVNMTFGRQETTLKDLLRAAKNAKGSWMWLSAESCRACDL